MDFIIIKTNNKCNPPSISSLVVPLRKEAVGLACGADRSSPCGHLENPRDPWSQLVLIVTARPSPDTSFATIHHRTTRRRQTHHEVFDAADGRCRPVQLPGPRHLAHIQGRRPRAGLLLLQHQERQRKDCFLLCGTADTRQRALLSVELEFAANYLTRCNRAVRLTLTTRSLALAARSSWLAKRSARATLPLRRRFPATMLSASATR